MKRIFHEIQHALKTKTGKNTQLTLIGQVIIAGVGYLINIVLLRNMSPDQFGTFSLFSSVIMFIAGLLHLGWMESFVRFGAEYAKKPEFPAVNRFFFRRIFWASLILSLTISCLAPWISDHGYHRKDFTWYFVLGVGGAFLTSISNYLLSYFRAHQLFKEFIKIQAASTIFRLALCLGVVWFGLPVLASFSGIQLLAPFSILVLGYFFMKGHPALQYAPSSPLDPALGNKFKSYNTWIFISLTTTHLIGNIDSQFLAHYHSNQTLAAFSAAARLTLPIQFVILSITTTILPRLSASKNQQDTHLYLSKLKFFLAPLAILILLSCWLLPPALIWLAGESYRSITHLIQLQILTVLIVLLTNPVGLVLYVWGWSKGFAYLNILQLIIDVILNYAWVPKQGASGAILATLSVNLIGLIYVYCSVFYNLKHRRA